MLTTVIICSRNGERMLARSIERVLASLEDAGGGELILVDSASTDGTLAVMRAVQADPRTSVIALPAAGQAIARNAGLCAAQGEVVLFTDDDVLVPVHWVAALSAPLAAGAHLVAGAVHLAPDLTYGLSLRQCELLADTRYMNLAGPRPRTVVGASMGLRRDLVDLGFRFEPALGPGAIGFMDDSFFHTQVVEAGGSAVLVEDAPVEHHPRAVRLTEAMWDRRAYQQGMSEAWIQHHWRHERPSLRDLRAFAAAEVRGLGQPRRTEHADTADIQRARGLSHWWLRNWAAPRRYRRREVPARLG